ncbi:maleylpyruvate isomerase family mycothiol-dependent enzyme [Mycobacterium sp. CVI_P3]|uniref:Maleylpyruvate isomerase family mycothiol-dependent enzyme n=1 Tax=Mycobacterium pinniadriaticum TaxID=2994102 RepID=A0ABT3SKL8_9MYCO|nr:maleylpyruvate isomerase family mycothiol-dependent enzyme [Mycobacterium pinniadriaticum]MCX2933649.1 maleylpyruvate isomerase family mycothiol-dependent enzyme [Mycobacterium pinniadriaticum]MCX2940064.1 maleylpyruvate isomerase family mycothiol-dependent enzyme [Mycobacterium pinniadriaticum]
MDVTTMATAERADFADMLLSLTGAQWKASTLCGEWRARDVAAHVVAYLDRYRGAFTAALIRHRLRMDRLNARDVDAYSTCSLGEIAERMRSGIVPHSVGTGFGGRVALVECMIHQQDIRRPLELPRTIPAERLREALAFTRVAPLIRGGWRARGVRLIATDLEWAAGRGAEVRGSGEAILMAMAGRRSALDDLAGPGVTVLAARSSAN